MSGTNTGANAPITLDFLEEIVAVHWGTSGIAFFEYTYNLSDGNSPPAPMQATLAGLPYGTSFSVLGSVTATYPGKFTTAVVDPITPAMKSNLLQWTPKPAYQHASQVVYPASNFWYVDGASTPGGAPLDACGGEAVEVPIPTNTNWFLEAYYTPGQSFPIILTTTYPGPGFDTHETVLQARQPVNTVAQANPIVSPQNKYPSAAAAQAAADLINSTLYPGGCGSATNPYGLGHSLTASVAGPLVDTTGSSLYALQGTAVFALNLGLIKKLLPAGSTTLSFTFSAAASASATHSWALAAQAYTDRTSFPLSGKDAPLFTPFGQYNTGGNGGDGKTISINLKKLLISGS